MDDQLLEKRLDSLKKAYNDIPEEENRSAILAAIKKDQKKKTKNKWIHLPYAASFIGVGMIAGILMMQYIGVKNTSNEKTELSQATEDSKGEVLDRADVKVEFDSLRKYYYEKQKDTKEKLGLSAGYENRLYQNNLHEIDAAESDLLEHLATYNKSKFALVLKQLKGTIDESFTVPSDIMEEISEDPVVHEAGRREELLLVQLESFWGAFYQSMVLYEWELDQALEKESASAVIDKLNAGGKDFKTQGLKKLAAGAVENGYAFREEDEKIVPFINYTGVADRLKESKNQDYLKYLRLKSNKIQNQQGKVMSYQKLGELLVKLEKEIQIVRDYTVMNWLTNDAQSLYALFVLGSQGNPLFDENDVLKEEVKNAYQYVINNYVNTDTGSALKIYYEQLERKSFKKPEEIEVDHPKYLHISGTPKKSEEGFRQSIHLLSDELLSTYKEFAAKKNANILKNYGPFEIMQLYFYADSQKDYATKYALYSIDDGKPTEEQYINVQRAANINLSQILKGYEYSTLYHPDQEPEKITGVQLHFTNQESMVFQMVQEQGIWKVRYMPLQ
jgi:hypothetical protein